jgi:hypothetical protein
VIDPLGHDADFDAAASAGGEVPRPGAQRVDFGWTSPAALSPPSTLASGSVLSLRRGSRCLIGRLTTAARRYRLLLRVGAAGGKSHEDRQRGTQRNG